MVYVSVYMCIPFLSHLNNVSHTVHTHCTHTLYTHTVHTHCTHTLYTHTVHTHCTHTLYTHTLYTHTHIPLYPLSFQIIPFHFQSPPFISIHQAVEKINSSAIRHPIVKHNMVVFRGGHDALQVCVCLYVCVYVGEYVCVCVCVGEYVCVCVCSRGNIANIGSCWNSC